MGSVFLLIYLYSYSTSIYESDLNVIYYTLMRRFLTFNSVLFLAGFYLGSVTFIDVLSHVYDIFRNFAIDNHQI